MRINFSLTSAFSLVKWVTMRIKTGNVSKICSSVLSHSKQLINVNIRTKIHNKRDFPFFLLKFALSCIFLYLTFTLIPLLFLFILHWTSGKYLYWVVTMPNAFLPVSWRDKKSVKCSHIYKAVTMRHFPCLINNSDFYRRLGSNKPISHQPCSLKRMHLWLT